MEPNQNSNNMINGMPPTPSVNTNKKVGPMIGALVVILVIILAALYFFGKGKTVTEDVNDTQVEAQLESDLEAQLQEVEYSF